MIEPLTSEVVTNDRQPALENSAPKPSTAIPKWETSARERMRGAIKKFSKPLADLVARDANEGDTRLLVTDMLCEGFGFDKYAELTTEYRVKGEFADYGIRLDKDLIAFLEVKRVATKLSAKHLRQVESYAVNEGVEWVILTSGVVWQVYHITGGLPIVVDLALEVDLFGEDTVAQKASLLYYLTKESLKRRQIDTLWQAKRATSPKSLARVLCSEKGFRHPITIDLMRMDPKLRKFIPTGFDDLYAVPLRLRQANALNDLIRVRNLEAPLVRQRLNSLQKKYLLTLLYKPNHRRL